MRTGACTSWLRLFGLSLVLGSITACETTRGRPDYFMNTVKTTPTNAAMLALTDVTEASDRNNHLRKALADVDAFYIPFRDEFISDDNGFNAFVDLASLFTDLAGRQTESIAAKNSYLSIGALLTGTRSTINNRFLYAQTSLALVKGMDAARAEQELAIKTKMGQPIGTYTGRDAYADVLSYYSAGTIPGGLNWLQSNAEKEQKENTEAVSKVYVPTDEQLQKLENLQDVFEAALVDPANLAKLPASWGVPALGTDDERRIAARKAYQERFPEDEEMHVNAVKVLTELKASGFLQ